MMPDIDREARRKKRVPVIALLLFGTAVVAVLLQAFQPGWQWVSFAVGVTAISAVGVSIDPPRRHGRSSRQKGSGPTGHGRDDDDGAAAAYRWRVLAVVSRLMPRAAGRRWLAEAESLLPDIAPARRGAAIRSYLRSAPRLVVIMWVHQAQRLGRPGPRRPR
jgi:hypothetical protein